MRRFVCALSAPNQETPGITAFRGSKIDFRLPFLDRHNRFLRSHPLLGWLACRCYHWGSIRTVSSEVARMRYHRLLLTAVLALICVAAPTAAGGEPFLKFWDDLHVFSHESTRAPYEERIETERHDFTQSTDTVGQGVVQIEAGYSYFYKDKDEEIENSHTTPETMVRIGLSDDIEFRLRFTYDWRFIDVEEDLSGSQDLLWSFKLRVTDQDGWIPESAVELRATAPTGGSDWSLDRVAGGFDFIYGWELTEGCELYGSTGCSTGGLGDFSLLPEDPAGDQFVVWSQSVALGIELTEQVTFYSEWFGQFSHALEDNFTMQVYNVGFDYYLTQNLVLDVRAGVGLSEDADDFFTGVGGGYRF